MKSFSMLALAVLISVAIGWRIEGNVRAADPIFVIRMGMSWIFMHL